MIQRIPVDYLDLLEKKAYAHLATLMPDGSPHVSPVWVGLEGENLVVNSARGRQKDHNVRRDARVALDIQDPENPYRYMMIRGTVIDISEEGADESINQLAVKYTGEKYKWRKPGMVRVIYRIRPVHISTAGG